MTPATLSAIARGDLANALVASTPGGIERQEAQGQRDLIASTTLPKEIDGATREQLTAIGFVFGDDVDELFVNCQLPAGWVKKATDHSMHSDLLDDKGRRRAGIFYKAAFYDRKADMRMERRFNIDGYSGSDEKAMPVLVTDCEAPLHKVGEYDRTAPKYWDVQRELDTAAREWLAANHPDWQDPLAYWD